jgi:hypothetical protein
MQHKKAGKKGKTLEETNPLTGISLNYQIFIIKLFDGMNRFAIIPCF